MLNIYIKDAKIVKIVRQESVEQEYIDPSWEVVEHADINDVLFLEGGVIVRYQDSQARLDRIQELQNKDRDEYEQEELDSIL